MNFSNHYFKEETIQEGPVADVIKGGPGTALKAGAKGLGRAIANVARGATGRTKTMAFEPNWLKIMKPVDLKTYKDLINKYANWKTQKTKLGPKKNFTITDNRDGRLGEFSKDKFTEIIGRFDKNAQNKLEALGDVKDLQNPKEVKIPMRMHVYIYNNGGKAIFFDMPANEDGSKRIYAVGLDNKAERAFRQVHGMPFQDYELVTGKEPQKQDINKLTKVPLDKSDYNKLAPKKESNYSLNKSNYILNLFEDEIMEANEVKVIKKDGKWFTVTNNAEVTKDMVNKNKDLEYIAVKDKDSNKDNNLQKEFKKDLGLPEDEGNKPNEIDGKKAVRPGTGGDWFFIDKDNKELEKVTDDDFKKGNLVAVTSNDVNKEDEEGNKDALNKEIERVKGENKESSDTSTSDKSEVKDKGAINKYIENEIEGEPAEVKKTGDAEEGWRFNLKNKGVLFLYKSSKNGKYYLSYNVPAEDIAERIIDGEHLERGPEIPESYIPRKKTIKENYIQKMNHLLEDLDV